MKNKIYKLLVIFFCASNLVHSQNIYNFSHSTSTYTPLANPTVLVNTPAGFNGSYLTIPLSFSFQYWQTPYTNFVTTTSAYCSFTAGTYGFYPFYSSLKSLGNSQIGYETTGVTPNRILKVEWKHVGFTNDATSTDSTSFQIWIYESSNVIEMHFGPSNINSAHFQSLFGSAVGPQIVLDRPDGGDFYNLQGNAASPTMMYHPTTFLYITGYHGDGVVYTFSPASSTGISELSMSNAVSISPNPVSESFSLSMNDLKNISQKESTVLKVYNAAGTLILHRESVSSNENIDFAGQPNGIYYAQIISGNKSTIKKIIKQ